MASHGTAGPDRRRLCKHQGCCPPPHSVHVRSKYRRRILQMAPFKDVPGFLNHLKFLSFPTAAAGAHTMNYTTGSKWLCPFCWCEVLTNGGVASLSEGVSFPRSPPPRLLAFISPDAKVKFYTSEPDGNHHHNRHWVCTCTYTIYIYIYIYI